MKDILSKFQEEDFSCSSFSYKYLISPASYERCDFSNCDINYAVFKNVIFNRCDFSNADISGAEFEDCDFLDCRFEYTNLTSSIFSGCNIINNETDINISGIKRSSTSGICFRSSERRRSIIKNILLKDIGFRESIFENTDFIGIVFESISIEDSRFIGCYFDSLDLCFNNVKGALIKRCSAGKFEITIEKLLSITGVEFLDDCKDYKIYASSNKEFEITGKANLAHSIQSIQINLLQTGAIFEFVNACIFELFISNKRLDSKVLTKVISVFMEKYNGRVISPKNLINLIDLFINYEIMSVDLTQKLSSIARIVINKDTADKHKAMFLYKMEKISIHPVSSHNTLLITDYTSDFNVDSRRELTDVVTSIMLLARLDESRSMLQVRGSVIEQVLVNSDLLAKNFWQLFFVLLVFGFKYKKKTKSGSIIEFNISPFKSNNTDDISNPENEVDGLPIDIKNEVRQALEESGININQMEDEIGLTKKELEEAERIKGLLDGKDVNIKIRKALVKELLDNNKVRDLLLESQSK